MASEWVLHPVWEGRGALARALGAPELVAQLLYNRGVREVDEARAFLTPSMNDLIEPERLTGALPAAERIAAAVRSGEKITIYGDYDVDGITGAAILWRCLQLAGREVEFYVPHRIDEGYGLNTDAIRKIAGDGTNLIVTVDCGVTAHESAAVAKELGVELIVTDHHKLEGGLPDAAAVVHPDLPGQDYPNPHLCGAGVAFKLAWALAQQLNGGAKKVSAEFREFLIAAVSLAALGTVADVVPLRGENRTIAKFGLQGLPHCENVGIRALIQASGLTGAKLESTDIGFRLAPRLNAAGRMGHARLAVELFTRSNEQRAREIARYLEGQNQQRQKVERSITEEAVAQVKALGMDKDAFRGVVVAGENWHAGVVGIVASRVVDKFGKPTVVLSVQDDKVSGSCRSVKGFDMVEALGACDEHLNTFGGHAMAAGLTLAHEQVEAFRVAFNRYALENLDADAAEPVLEIDAEVTLGELHLKAVELLHTLAPFGAGNPEIRLVARGLRLVQPPRKMGKKGEHLQFMVAEGEGDQHLKPGGVMRAVAFSKAKWEKKLLSAERIDVVFEPHINRFNGNATVEMIVEDYRESE